MLWILYVALGGSLGFGLCAILTAGKIADNDSRWLGRLDKQQETHEAQELSLSTFWRSEVERLNEHVRALTTPDLTPVRQSKSTDEADENWYLTHAGIEREVVDG